jgi:hypothetical protein
MILVVKFLKIKTLFFRNLKEKEKIIKQEEKRKNPKLVRNSFEIGIFFNFALYK